MTAPSIFSASLFGTDLARKLDALYALQPASDGDERRYFFKPVGTSFYEAEMLTRHCDLGDVQRGIDAGLLMKEGGGGDAAAFMADVRQDVRRARAECV